MCINKLPPLQSESLKRNTFQWFIVLRLEGKYIWTLYKGRVILSNYFDTTFDEYCFK